MVNDFKDFVQQISVTVVIQRFMNVAGSGSAGSRINRYWYYLCKQNRIGCNCNIFIDNEDGSNDVFIVKNGLVLLQAFTRSDVRK